MTQLNVIAILLLEFQECAADQGSDRSSLFSHLDVGSDVTRKSNQNNLRSWIKSCWKSAQMKDDAENLSCLLNLQLGESMQ